jgi:signal transduction histidine kinase
MYSKCSEAVHYLEPREFIPAKVDSYRALAMDADVRTAREAPTVRRARLLAGSAWILTTSVSAAALVFLILGRSTPQPPGSFGFRGFGIMLAMSFGSVGALLATRKPGNPIGWLFLAMGIPAAIEDLSQQYAIYALLVKGGTLPLGEAAAWMPSWVYIPGTAGLVFVLHLFPTGRLPSPRWRPVLWVGGVAIVVAVVGNALAPGELQNFRPVENPFGVGSRDALLGIGHLGQLIYALTALLGAISLVFRFRRAGREERQQLKWLAYAGALLATALVPTFLWLAIAGSAAPPALAAVTILGFVSIPVAVAIAVMKYRLYDIDALISKTLVFGILAGFITAVYVGVVVGIGSAVGTRSEPNLALSIAATGIVAVGFQPVRERAQHLANRLVYGERATPYEVLSAFSTRVAGVEATEEVLPRMARILSEGTGAMEAQVWLRVGEALRLEATWPAEIAGEDLPLAGEDLPPFVGMDRAMPVRYRGELLGALSIRKPPGEPLTPGEAKLLTDLAAQAGLVLRNVRLNEELRTHVVELRESRQRLVSVQDAERRKIERDLHDGAQQHLVALSINLSVAKSLVGADPEQLRQMLEQLRSDAGDALQTLRDLAHGIYPPLLADRGLVEALTAHARKGSVPTTVEATDVGRHAMEVEAAIYFCVLEALQNVAKYGDGACAVVRLAADDGHLTFAVVDDGAGFDAARVQRGAGLTNMTDRLEALGGKLEVSSKPGAGTTISGWVPTQPSS